MESPPVEYRLVRIKSKPIRSEKHPLTSAFSKKSQGKKFKDSLNKKPYQSPYKHELPKQKQPKPNHVLPKNISFTSGPKDFISDQKVSLTSYGYLPQCYLQGPAVYTEAIFVPVYGYPINYLETCFYEKKATDNNSPQELDNCDCHTVASDEDLNGSFGDESEIKVVLNGSVIHKECCKNKDLAFQNFGVFSEHEEFALPFIESEPKSECISLPSFLT